jgi:hypothetical protein
VPSRLKPLRRRKPTTAGTAVIRPCTPPKAVVTLWIVPTPRGIPPLPRGLACIAVPRCGARASWMPLVPGIMRSTMACTGCGDERHDLSAPHERPRVGSQTRPGLDRDGFARQPDRTSPAPPSVDAIADRRADEGYRQETPLRGHAKPLVVERRRHPRHDKRRSCSRVTPSLDSKRRLVSRVLLAVVKKRLCIDETEKLETTYGNPPAADARQEWPLCIPRKPGVASGHSRRARLSRRRRPRT